MRLFDGGQTDELGGGRKVAGDAQTSEIEAAGLGVNGTVEGGEVELKGELPRERLSACGGMHRKETAIPRGLQEGMREVGKGLGSGGAEGRGRAVGLIGIPEERGCDGLVALPFSGLEAEGRLARSNEMKGSTRDIVALLIGGKENSVSAEANVRKAQTVGEDGGGLTVGCDVEDGASMFREFVFDVFFVRVEDASFGEVEGAVFSDG